jgi:hypothetical protein
MQLSKSFENGYHQSEDHGMKPSTAIAILLLSLVGPKDSQAATNLIRICYYQSIPAGYVILSRTQNPECGWGEPNAYWIGIPDPKGEAICTNSPMPAGWVINGRRTSSACGPFPNNTSNIKLPGILDDVCEYSPIPANYTVIGNVAMIGCAGQTSIFAGKRIKKN